MKNYYTPVKLFSAVGIALALFTSCDKAKFNTNALVKGDPIFYKVPATNTQTFSLNNRLEMDLNTWAKQNNFNPNSINSIKVAEFTLSIIDSSRTPYTFNEIDEVTWAVVSGGVEVASSTTNSFTKNNDTSVKLKVQDMDFKKILNDTNTTLRLSGSTNTPIEHEFQLKAQINYNVNATLND